MVRCVLVAPSALSVLAFGFGVAIAQTPSPAASTSDGAGKPAAQESATAVPALPRTLKGGIHFINPIANRQAFNGLEIEITNQDQAGKIAGTFTRFVQFPGAEQCIEFTKVPIDGAYDGTKLVINVRASAKKPGSCPDFTWEFGQGKDHSFERTAAGGSERVYFDLAK